MCQLGLDSVIIYMVIEIFNLLLRKENMKKLRIYKLTDIKKQEGEALEYWASKSIKEKIDAMEQIIKNYYKLKGPDLYEQRLQRVLRITKLSQS